MKKINNLLLALSLSILFLLTGCFSPVFYEIRKDVEPEDATVSGILNSITRYTVGDKEYLVVAAKADGDEDYMGLKYKDVTAEEHGAWQNFDLTSAIEGFSYHSYKYFNSEHSGYQIIKVLADSTYLYVVGAAYENNEEQGTTIPSEICVWGGRPTLNSDGSWASGEWQKIDVPENTFKLYIDSSYYYHSAFSIFHTNSPMQKNRKVYIRSGNADAYNSNYKETTYYSLENCTVTKVSISPSDSTEKSNISSVVMLNDKPVFFNSIASTSNETYTTEATRIYYGDGDNLYYSDADGSTTFVKALNAGNEISCLAACSDSILIGRAEFSATSTSAYGGLVKTSLTNGVPASELVSFETNASFQISTAYFVNALINSTPGKSELESALYASTSFIGSGTSSSSNSVSYDNVGLWSYYPSRGNWNRE